MKHTVNFLCDLVTTMRNHRGSKCRGTIKSVVNAYNVQPHVADCDRVKPNQVTWKLYRMKRKRKTSWQSVSEFEADGDIDTLVEPLLCIDQSGRPTGSSNKQRALEKVVHSTFKDVITMKPKKYIDHQTLDNAYRTIESLTKFENKKPSQKKAFDVIYVLR